MWIENSDENKKAPDGAFFYKLINPFYYRKTRRLRHIIFSIDRVILLRHIA